MSGLTPKYLKILKSEIISWSNRLARQGFLSGFEGNISVRLGKEMMLITRHQSDKENLSEDDIILTDLEGQAISGFQDNNYRASSEYRLHREIYRNSSDSRAVVHAHPRYAMLMGIFGFSFQPSLIAETALYYGREIPVAEFAMPGTDEVGASIRSYLPHAKAILLKNHGAVCHAPELVEAGAFMEMLEKVCFIHFQTKGLEMISNQEPFQPSYLSEEIVKKLLGEA